MMSKNIEGDSWGQLLSDFGIEDDIQEDIVAREVPVRASESVSSGPVGSGDFGAGVVDSEAEDAEDRGEQPQTREKKSIFSRFPKIQFFGAPPEVSLDAVIEGSKSPSLGGKAFTDNTLEVMPVSQERKDRQMRNRRGEGRGSAVEGSSALATVASQIDVLASGTGALSSGVSTKTEERLARRAALSMFDDPIPESEEFRALKDLMGEQPHRGEISRDTFRDEESDSRQRGYGRRKPHSEGRQPTDRQPSGRPLAEREVRGRGARYRPPVEVDDLPESDFQIMDNESTATRGRGRRGSKYSGNRSREPMPSDVPQEEWSEIDAALQAGTGVPAPRGGQQQRRHHPRRRPERIEETTMDQESWEGKNSTVAAIPGDIPSWDEAIGNIIASNIVRHKAYSDRGRR